MRAVFCSALRVPWLVWPAPAGRASPGARADQHTARMGNPLGLAVLAVVASVLLAFCHSPAPAYADDEVHIEYNDAWDFYSDLVNTVEVIDTGFSVDLENPDLTIGDFTAYYAKVIRSLYQPSQQQLVAERLQSAYGYDLIVNGKLESTPTSNGAFTSYPFQLSTLSRNANTLIEWVGYIVDQSDKVYGSWFTGGGGGGAPGTGGGVIPDTEGEYYSISIPSYTPTYSSGWGWNGLTQNGVRYNTVVGANQPYSTVPAYATVRISKAAYDKLNPTGYELFGYFNGDTSYPSTVTVNLFSRPIGMGTVSQNSNGIYSVSFSQACSGWSVVASSVQFRTSYYDLTYLTASAVSVSTSTAGSTNNLGSARGGYAARGISGFGSGNGSGDDSFGGGGRGGAFVDSPETPDYDGNQTVGVAPQLPNPGTNTTVVNNTTVNQTDVDLQPVIDAIGVVNDSLKILNQNLIALDDDLNTNFSALMGQIDAWSNYFKDQLEDLGLNLIAFFEHWDETIDYYMNYLGNQLSTMTQWLVNIYDKIGGRTIVNNPDIGNNPETEGLLDNFWEWFAGLVSKMLSMLVGDISDATDDAATLITKFPFCIPWDIAAFCTLFYHSPVTPEFDIPMPVKVDGVVMTQQIHIDLSPYDDIAAMARWFSVLTLCIGLAWRTPEVLKHLEV